MTVRLIASRLSTVMLTPLQKEPKLSRARQIPEWELYDTEIAKLTRRLAEEGKITSGLATADANVLAGAGTSAADKSTEDVAVELAESEVESHQEELTVEFDEESAHLVDEL